MYKKINIFVNGQYTCSTTQCKTCRKAVEHFKARPIHAGLIAPGRLGMVGTVISAGDKVVAHFCKN